MRLSYLFLIICALSLPFISGHSYGGVSYTGWWNGEFNGNNISFSFDSSEYEIKEIKAYGVPIIEKILLPPTYWVNSISLGELYIQTPLYNISIGNFSEPSLVLKSFSHKNIEIFVSDGAEIGNKGASIEKNGVHAEIISDSPLKLKGNKITIEMEKGDIVQIRFYMKSDHEQSSDAFKNAISSAFELHRIGAEAHVMKGAFSSISYNNISIKPLKIEEKRAILSIKSSDSEGKCIYLHLSMNATKMRVLLDNESVKEGSYYDALFSTGNEAIYNLTVSDGDRALLLYIPHFSEHTVTIESAENSVIYGPESPSPESSFIPVIVALLISIIAGALLIFRKKEPY